VRLRQSQTDSRPPTPPNRSRSRPHPYSVVVRDLVPAELISQPTTCVRARDLVPAELISQPTTPIPVSAREIWSCGWTFPSPVCPASLGWIADPSAHPEVTSRVLEDPGRQSRRDRRPSLPRRHRVGCQNGGGLPSRTASPNIGSRRTSPTRSARRATRSAPTSTTTTSRRRGGGRWTRSTRLRLPLENRSPRPAPPTASPSSGHRPRCCT
jgi:hypothetical protein